MQVNQLNLKTHFHHKGKPRMNGQAPELSQISIVILFPPEYASYLLLLEKVQKSRSQEENEIQLLLCPDFNLHVFCTLIVRELWVTKKLNR